MQSLSLRERDLAVLRSTLKRFPCVGEVRLFGSRATGTARRASDIDLAISAPDATADEWLEVIDALNDAPIIYEIDIVRLDRAGSPRLMERIALQGAPIYPELAQWGRV
jgi:predicted nucleotidyltransferase